MDPKSSIKPFYSNKAVFSLTKQRKNGIGYWRQNI